MKNLFITDERWRIRGQHCLYDNYYNSLTRALCRQIESRLFRPLRDIVGSTLFSNIQDNELSEVT